MSKKENDRIRVSFDIPEQEWAKKPNSCCEVLLRVHIHGPYLPNSEENGQQYQVEVQPVGIRYHPKSIGRKLN